MNQMTSTVEFERDTATPVPSIMTRREKLLRFAHIVRTSGRDFYIFHSLERWDAQMLRANTHSASAFAAAAADPILKDAGLAGESPADAMKFFELEQNELHEFSCDCGGAISNTKMADRIERLAEGKTTGMFSRYLGG